MADRVEPLTSTGRIDGELAPWLLSLGDVFRSFLEQDSGCISYGVETDGGRWFVKHASHAPGIASLRRALALNRAFRHEALPRLHNAFATKDGLALVYEWVDGESLYDYTRGRGEAARSAPHAAHARFRGLPPQRIGAALDTIYDAHVGLAGLGFVAVDFYDGSVIYDFEHHRTWLIDLDSYRPAPFVLEAARLPGSKRFMAPEESVRGSLIDQRTNVFTLGRTAFVLMGDGTTGRGAWKGGEARRGVALRAIAERPEERWASVADYARAWRDAGG